MIAFDIPIEFLLPEFNPCFGSGGLSTPLMTMPEAAVHKDRFPRGGKNNVRRTRKVTTMQAEPTAQRMERSPYYDFGFGVTWPNLCHKC